jgi:hypothetical protein
MPERSALEFLVEAERRTTVPPLIVTGGEETKRRNYRL